MNHNSTDQRFEDAALAPAKMAAELLLSGSQMILDHYWSTQGPRVLRLMKSEPLVLLDELWRSGRHLGLTAMQLARTVLKTEFNELAPEAKSEIRMEAYQALFPATETDPVNELSQVDRESLEHWLQVVAGVPSFSSIKVLFLHGKESGPGGTKPTFLAGHGIEVINPALPADDFEASVRIAQADFDRHCPGVVVGSSRGGAVAMNIDTPDARLVLMCPAWKKWGAARKVKAGTLVIHASTDEIIPHRDSEELLSNSGLPETSLHTDGTNHRLDTIDALVELLKTCAQSNRV